MAARLGRGTQGSLSGEDAVMRQHPTPEELAAVFAALTARASRSKSKYETWRRTRQDVLRNGVRHG